MDDLFIQGQWSRMAVKEGINWKEPRAPGEALRQWKRRVRGKLIVARMGGATALEYASYGAVRSPQLTQLARRVEELDLPAG